MTTRRLTVLVLLISVLSFLAGASVGLFQGMRAYGLIDSAPQGALAVANLHALEKGNDKPIKLLLESHVDSALGMYPYLQEQWWYPVFKSGWLVVDPSKYESYIERAATYRKSHVSPLREAPVPPDESSLSQDQKRMYAEIKEHHEKVDATVSKYAK